MTIQCANIFRSKASLKYTKIGIFVIQIKHLATLVRACKRAFADSLLRRTSRTRFQIRKILLSSSSKESLCLCQTLSSALFFCSLYLCQTLSSDHSTYPKLFLLLQLPLTLLFQDDQIRTLKICFCGHFLESYKTTYVDNISRLFPHG
jgi:hypothetical protein